METQTCKACGNKAERKCSLCKTAYYCSRECQKQDWKSKHKAVCCPSSENADDNDDDDLKVEVRPSSVHGYGVFATRKILQGEKIAYFRGIEFRDSKIKINMRKATPETGNMTSIVNASDVFRSILNSVNDLNMSATSPDPKSGILNIGDASVRTGRGIGQFINDFYRPNLDSDSDFGQCCREIETYQRKSTTNSNVELGPGYWFKAIKDIEPQSELFTHYGPGFWLQKTMLESADPFKRLLCYALQDQRTQAFDMRRFVNFDDETCKCFLKILIGYRLKDEEDPKDVLFNMCEKISMIPSISE